jgi:hypothetical protein
MSSPFPAATYSHHTITTDSHTDCQTSTTHTHPPTPTPSPPPHTHTSPLHKVAPVLKFTKALQPHPLGVTHYIIKHSHDQCYMDMLTEIARIQIFPAGVVL